MLGQTAMSVCLIIFTVDVFSTLFLAKNQFLTIFLNNDFSLKKYMCLTLYTSSFLAKNLWQNSLVENTKKATISSLLVEFWKTGSINGGLFS